jgi:hypothetical protein
LLFLIIYLNKYYSHYWVIIFLFLSPKVRRHLVLFVVLCDVFCCPVLVRCFVWSEWQINFYSLTMKFKGIINIVWVSDLWRLPLRSIFSQHHKILVLSHVSESFLSYAHSFHSNILTKGFWNGPSRSYFARLKFLPPAPATYFSLSGYCNSLPS